MARNRRGSVTYPPPSSIFEYEAVGEMLDDTLKALNKLNPGLDTLLTSLKGVRRRKPAKPAPPAS